MKVLHVSTSDSFGGAARAAHRIHAAQVASGMESSMLVLYKGTSDPRVAIVSKSLPKRIGDVIRRAWFDFHHRAWRTDNPVLHTFGDFGADIVDELNACDADVLNLHWVSKLLSIADIGRLRKPLVWTLHDMWPFCGGEHYAADAAEVRFRDGYSAGNRPINEHGPDLNRRSWEAKRRAWAGLPVTIVSPSSWLADCARQSVLFAGADVHVIPNTLDTDLSWRPIAQQAARKELGLPAHLKLVLTGAMGGKEDPRKGGDLLEQVMQLVVSHSRVEVELVIFGQTAPTSGQAYACRTHWLGEVSSDRFLALAYAAADVMVVPSRQDNLPNTAVEAQACGTPVAAFSVGGLPDIVVHRETGFLARPFNVNDMADGIIWLLEDDARIMLLRNKARDNALSRFSPHQVAAKYKYVYEGALRQMRRPRTAERRA